MLETVDEVAILGRDLFVDLFIEFLEEALFQFQISGKVPNGRMYVEFCHQPRLVPDFQIRMAVEKQYDGD